MCPKYWNYVERHTPLYKYFDKHCSNQNYKCPKFYTDCKKYDPREVLENFHCHAEMKKKKADTLAKARQELPASIPPGQEANSGMLASSGFSAGGSHLTRDGTHQTTKTGDILLGVVATSLTSGALYREELYAIDLEGTIIVWEIYMGANMDYLIMHQNHIIHLQGEVKNIILGTNLRNNISTKQLSISIKHKRVIVYGKILCNNNYFDS
ncbi:hypothetical protein PVIIG_06107 [Plasmodium vivax India VII]|uniref:Uncharacterized protein n=1 Tax=Plasmodium vivax India VII TaxID=1077284 RepID=A0A0J9S5Q3_PLAVI|nr:hypothetical protein PVIIG_06107 [Plasmodium vivax India VII]